MAEYDVTATTDQAAGPEGDAAPVPTPRHPEWRSRTDRGDPNLTTFVEPYKAGDSVRVKGARGFSKVYTISQVLGNGYYRLQDGILLLPKTYVQGDLSLERRS
ncbi:hypothetical protein MMC07_001772 [Pseudocyphellaria aurata]|nr:hypothetical protein [Pseudocyphellaria aurata]